MMNLKIGGYDMLKKKLQKNYIMLNNNILQSQKLSFGARGLYVYIKSRELEKNPISDIKELAENGNISVLKCKKLLAELFYAGLIDNI